MSERLLVWYSEQGRDLPWRKSRDPYRIWLSEIMLQQTAVTTVIGYFQRFLKHFPTVQSLAAAELEDVLTQWAGLGYYSRARNLHKAAQLIVDAYNGQLPQSVEQLQRLPGVGRSTAGAIACLAFDQPEPILDGNVRRVLCRLMAVKEPARDRAVETRLWSVAEQLVPTAAAHDYTQAIMDLGATVCTPKRPDCNRCPLADVCVAREHNLTTVIPVTTKRKAVPTRRQVIVLINCAGEKLIRRRKTEGLLGGMLEFPVGDLPKDADIKSIVRKTADDCSCSGEPVQIGSIRHIYSHFRLEAMVYAVACTTQALPADSALFWVTDEKLDTLALHGAHKKALALSRTIDKDL